MQRGEVKMKRIRTKLDLSEFPEELITFVEGAEIYDSSCSPEARVIFIDKDCGYYLKSSYKGK